MNVWLADMRDLTARASWRRRALAYPLAALFIALYLLAKHPEHD